MLSKHKVLKQIDKAECIYRECWQFLVKLKNFSEAQLEIKELFEFQPKLAHCLFELDEIYRILHNEKKATISKKQESSKLQIERRLRSIGSYQETIKQTIAVGKSLGDSFIWLFYHQQRKFLEKHLLEEQQFHLPPGLGGKGERAFIESCQLIDENIVLYHGITNMLRLGDISLINLKTFELTAVGELKTKKIDEERIEVFATIVRPENKAGVITTDEPELPPSKIDSPQDVLDPKLYKRLEKQITSIQSSFEFPSDTSSVKMSLDSYTHELEALLGSARTAKVTYRRVSNGLMLVAYSDARRKLSSKFIEEIDFSQGSWGKRSSGLRKEVSNLLEVTKAREPLVSRLFSPTSRESMLPGATPSFWWPIKEETIEKILFHDVQLYTIFSPNYLFQKMKDCGYKIEYSEKEKKHGVSKILDGKVVYFFGLRHFIDMVAKQLYKEDVVVRMFDTLSDEFQKEKVPANSKIGLNIIQKFF